MNLSLTVEEQQALMDVLECSISELHTEIMHTDRRDLRQCLKDRKELLVNLLSTMHQTTGQTGHVRA